MTWDDLFDRAAGYEVTTEAVRSALRERRAEPGEEP